MPHLLSTLHFSSEHPTFLLVVSRNYTKPFFIAGFILGELYVALLLLAPKASGQAGEHWSGALTAILLFGPFGGAAGGGIGLLVSAVASKLKR